MHRVELKVDVKELVKRCAQEVFLMHRVELKAISQRRQQNKQISVPNAPCGVERLMPRFPSQAVYQFLMHRVELKGEV